MREFCDTVRFCSDGVVVDMLFHSVAFTFYDSQSPLKIEKVIAMQSIDDTVRTLAVFTLGETVEPTITYSLRRPYLLLDIWERAYRAVLNYAGDDARCLAIVEAVRNSAKPPASI